MNARSLGTRDGVAVSTFRAEFAFSSLFEPRRQNFFRYLRDALRWNSLDLT